MGRWCLILASAMAALSGANCQAQWYGGWGGYTETATPYSAAVRSQAEMTMAQAAAAESYAKASIANEQARSLYLENEARFIQLRRANRDAKDAREEQKKQEQKARAALRPPPKPVTAVYPRLSSDQIDPLSGDYGVLGPADYTPCRKFLTSLSVEGNHAQEALR